MKVALLHDDVGPDADPDELDVFAQIEAIGSALVCMGHETEVIACTTDLSALCGRIRASGAAIAFNLVESLAGQGRLIHLVPSVLDAAGIAYTGAPAEAIFTTSCKPLAKQLMAAADVPTPAWLTSDGRGDGQGKALQRMIIKSVWEHASKGLDDNAVVEPEDADSLLAEVRRRAAALGGEAFAEEYIEGREFNLSILDSEQGPQVLPAAEIRFEGFAAGRPRILGYTAKWAEDSADYRQTVRSFEFAPYEQGLLKHLQNLALRCWKLFGLRGYARVDFRVDEAGRPWVLEVNANPCLSPDAGFAAALREAGVSYDEAIERIVRSSHDGNRT
jgi:D-alanine-D-alanine ligase